MTVLTEYDKMRLDLEVHRPRNAKAVAGSRKEAPKNHRVLNYAWSCYRIIQRFTEIQPFVVCYNYDSTDHTWGQGHYFDTLEDAITYLYNLKHGN